nr:unnamed protein product [Naegleria fowleri]
MSLSTLTFENQIDHRQDIPLLECATRCTSPPQYLAMALAAIGSTIGDALGSPFENKSPNEISNMWILKKSNSSSSLTTNSRQYVFPKKLCHLGLIYTDDTQMSISLIESYLINQRLDPIYIKTLWKALSKQDWFSWAGSPLSQYQFGGFRGTGKNFRESVDSLNAECDNDISRPTAGNGVAMRSWPCAIAACRKDIPYYDQIEQLRKDVLMNGELTHKDIFGIVPAYGIAWLTYQWIQGNLVELNTFELIREVIQEIKSFEIWLSQFPNYQNAKERIYSTSLKAILDELSSSHTSSNQELIDIATKTIVEISNLTTKQNVKNANDGFAMASVTCALFHAIILRNEDFLVCLKRVIDVGGDTDTVASMVGAMVGAYKGWAINISNSKWNSNSNSNSKQQFAYFVVQQVVGFEYLYEFYRHFIEWTLGMHSNEDVTMLKNQYCGFLLQQEKAVTRIILSVENDKRTPHYKTSSPMNMVTKIGNRLATERSQFFGNDEEFVEKVIPKYANEIEWMSDSDIQKIYSMVFKKHQMGQYGGRSIHK